MLPLRGAFLVSQRLEVKSGLPKIHKNIFYGKFLSLHHHYLTSPIYYINRENKSGDVMLEIALIGCGAWGSSYLKTLSTMPDVKLAYVCDLNQDVIQKVNRINSQAKVITDYHRLLNDRDVRAVVIATPPPSHYQIAADCLSGGKSVLIEKPMTTDLKDAEKLVELAEQTGQVLMTGHLMEYHPAVELLKEFIRQGMFGEIKFLNFERTNFNVYRHDVNVLWDLAVHDLTVLSYLLDREPKGCWAKGINWQGKLPLGTALISLKYADGILAHIHANWHYCKKARQFTVVGTKMAAVFDDTRDFDKKLLLIEANGAQRYVQVPPVQPLYLQCAHFIDCIVNNKSPRTGGANALKIMKQIEQIQKSLDENQPVSL